MNIENRPEIIRPYFVPVFDIGEPLSDRQLRGLITYLREDVYSNEHHGIVEDVQKNLVGLTALSEPTSSGRNAGRRVDVNRTKIPQTHTLSIKLELESGISGKALPYKGMKELLTFADNALSWGDSISMRSTGNLKLELDRRCEHFSRCRSTKKPLIQRVLEKVS